MFADEVDVRHVGDGDRVAGEVVRLGGRHRVDVLKVLVLLHARLHLLAFLHRRPSAAAQTSRFDYSITFTLLWK